MLPGSYAMDKSDTDTGLVKIQHVKRSMHERQ